MVREHKVKAVDELADTLSRSKVAILTDFRGVPVNAVTQLRRQFREAGIEYRVVKNTLAAFAAQKTQKDSLKELLQGPTAIAFGFRDEIAPARVLSEYIKSSGAGIKIKGAIIGHRVLSSGEAALLHTLPSKEILLASLLGKMKAPIAGVVSVLAAPMRGLLGVLEARARQLEGTPTQT